MIGSKLDIFKKEWLDVVFQGRNREYGAYELRKLSPKATNIGLVLIIAVVVLLSLPKVFNINLIPEKEIPPAPVITEVTMEDLDELEPPEPEEEEILATEEQPQQIAQEPPAEDLIRFPDFEVTPKEKVKEEVAAQEEFKENKTPARITLKGTPGSKGVPTGEFGPKKVDGQVTGVEKGNPEGGNPDAIFSAVEVNPEPPGGMKAFIEWVGRTYVYPQSAIDNGAQGLVEVSFVVERDGSLTDIQVKRDFGYGTGPAAVAVLKKAKNWKPGVQNGRKVRVSYTLPIRLNAVQ